MSTSPPAVPAPFCPNPNGFREEGVSIPAINAVDSTTVITRQDESSPSPANVSGLLRWPALSQLIGDVSRSTIDRLDKVGRFPTRVIISPGTVGWRKAEVLAWLQARESR